MLLAFQTNSMGKFGRRLAIESHVRPTLVVVPSAAFDDRFCFLQRFKLMQIQAFIPKRPIKAFDMAAIGWFSWPAEIDSCLMIIGP